MTGGRWICGTSGRQNAKQPPNRTPEVFVWTYYVRENISDINLIIKQNKLCNIGRALGHTHLDKQIHMILGIFRDKLTYIRKN
jgi:hypothetical protein